MEPSSRGDGAHSMEPAYIRVSGERCSVRLDALHVPAGKCALCRRAIGPTLCCTRYR
jgi:hypothetical protein